MDVEEAARMGQVEREDALEAATRAIADARWRRAVLSVGQAAAELRRLYPTVYAARFDPPMDEDGTVWITRLRDAAGVTLFDCQESEDDRLTPVQDWLTDARRDGFRFRSLGNGTLVLDL
jgi:hypothetical protein